MSTQVKCEKCKQIRELPLHLHELSLYSDLLETSHHVYQKVNGKFVPKGMAYTSTVSKWLRISSQLERVTMNSSRYETAHFYCEPVNDFLDSNAKHHESIATPLTRFMYVANALEECYRLANHTYVTTHSTQNKGAYRRNHSAQAAVVMEQQFVNNQSPTHYDHMISEFLRHADHYSSEYNVNFDVDLHNNGNSSYGLRLVRVIRNQIAHGTFPIVENPEYHDLELQTKRSILILPGLATRLAAINIQILLSLVCKQFKSIDFFHQCEDPDYGRFFKDACTPEYLLNLHHSRPIALGDIHLRPPVNV